MQTTSPRARPSRQHSNHRFLFCTNGGGPIDSLKVHQTSSRIRSARKPIPAPSGKSLRVTRGNTVAPPRRDLRFSMPEHSPGGHRQHRDRHRARPGRCARCPRTGRTTHGRVNSRRSPAHRTSTAPPQGKGKTMLLALTGLVLFLVAAFVAVQRSGEGGTLMAPLAFMLLGVVLFSVGCSQDPPAPGSPICHSDGRCDPL